jgi:hypothetical protein
LVLDLLGYNRWVRLHCVSHVFCVTTAACPRDHLTRYVDFSNLASFLVSPQVDVYRISTIEQAMRLSSNICVQAGGVLTNILEQKYGKETLNLVPKDSEATIFQGLRDGSCEVVAHQLNAFRIYEKNRDANSDCSLSSEKRVIEFVPAGMATAIDTGADYCTSLISYVLDYHLTKMISEGFIEKAMKMHLGKTGTIQCIKQPPRGGDFGGNDVVSLVSWFMFFFKEDLAVDIFNRALFVEGTGRHGWHLYSSRHFSCGGSCSFTLSVLLLSNLANVLIRDILCSTGSSRDLVPAPVVTQFYNNASDTRYVIAVIIDIDAAPGTSKKRIEWSGSCY